MHGTPPKLLKYSTDDVLCRIMVCGWPQRGRRKSPFPPQHRALDIGLDGLSLVRRAIGAAYSQDVGAPRVTFNLNWSGECTPSRKCMQLKPPSRWGRRRHGDDSPKQKLTEHRTFEGLLTLLQRGGGSTCTCANRNLLEMRERRLYPCTPNLFYYEPQRYMYSCALCNK